MDNIEEAKIRTVVSNLKSYWNPRNQKFTEWYNFLTLVDTLYTRGMETYVSNEPQTFYNMAHYLLTKGDISHIMPVSSEVPIELDRRAKVNRACQYMWEMIDKARQGGGEKTFIGDFGFYVLVTGWYGACAFFDKDTGTIIPQIWNPANVYPLYQGGKLATCVHSYPLTEDEAAVKAELNNWAYTPRGLSTAGLYENVILDNIFRYDTEGNLWNIVFIDGRPVTPWEKRDNMIVRVGATAGFSDKGALNSRNVSWKKLYGRSIFEVNVGVSTAFNKWKSIMSQVLRENARPITQEFSSSPQASPEQIREGAHFHYNVGEAGFQRVPPASLPIELTTNLQEIRREMQKGSFSDAVYGMVDQQPGYAVSIMATSSANQILYPYMEAKHYLLSEIDSFWLKNLKTTRRTFEIRGDFSEKLQPKDIPDNVLIRVTSDVATPKDWMERGTIYNLLKDALDEDTLMTEILHIKDPQGVKRRMKLDKAMQHPMTQQLELISAYENHAKYLESRGDKISAERFRKAAAALEGQMGVPPPGSASPAQYNDVKAKQEAAAPESKPRVSPGVSPPEARSGFTPQQLREQIGSGTLRS